MSVRLVRVGAGGQVEHEAGLSAGEARRLVETGRAAVPLSDLATRLVTQFKQYHPQQRSSVTNPADPPTAPVEPGREWQLFSMFTPQPRRGYSQPAPPSTINRNTSKYFPQPGAGSGPETKETTASPPFSPPYVSSPAPASHPVQPITQLSPLSLSQFSSQQARAPPAQHADSLCDEDQALEDYIELRMEELISESVNVQESSTISVNNEVKKPFSFKRPEEAQRSKPVFLPPLRLKPKRSKIEVSPEKLAAQSEVSLNPSISKRLPVREMNYPLPSPDQKILSAAIESPDIVLNEKNQGNISDLLYQCKELGFLLVFRNGTTQLRDLETATTGLGSPEAVVVR